MTGGRRILVGCGIGCAALLVAAIVAGILIGTWVRRPGEPLEPRRLFGADTTGYLEWRLALDDPGTQAFVDGLLARASELQAENESQLPPWLRSWLSARRERESAEDLKALFPIVAAWTASRDDEGEHHLFTVSLVSAGNRLRLLDWGLGHMLPQDDDAEVIDHAGERIYHLTLNERGGSLTFFLRGNDIFVLSDPAAARRAVDRLASAADAPETETGLDRLFDTTGEAPLRAACANDAGELARWWRTLGLAELADGAPWDEARGLGLAGRLEGDGSLVGTLELRGPDAAWAERHAATFRDAVERGLAAAPLELAVEIAGRAVGDRVQLDYRVPDLPARLGGYVGGGVEIGSGSGRIRIGS
jgi:hypothetical protein